MRRNRLYGLIWLAALIACWALLLDWREVGISLRNEALLARSKQTRELAALKGLDWMAESTRARAARLVWMKRFLESDTPGLMRVNALEYVKKLCEEAKAGCAISLIGGDVDTGALQPPKGPPGASMAGAAGVSAVKVKVAFVLSPETLLGFLRLIERGDKLGRVDRVLVSGPRVEIQLSVFGVDGMQARKLRAGVAAETGDST